MKTKLIATALLGLTASALNAQQQPPPLQLNVPYHCQNGMTVIVNRCERKGETEYCFFRGGQNGQLGNEASMPRAQLAALGLLCTVQAGGSSAQTGAAHARVAQAGVQPAPAPNPKGFNPPYLSEMPSVERVMQAMKTNDPRETALRQMVAFYELIEIIKTLSGHREFRGYLPDEKKILDDYSMAQYNVGQAADKAFPGPYKGEKQFSEYAP